MTRMLVYAAFTALAAMTPTPADAQAPGKFDHLRTGFALTGAHQAARCDSCHVRGVFKGTPRQCASCHTAARRIATTVMSANHIPVSQPCESCHNTSTFAGARFSHVAIAPGSCASCHNGARAKGKPAGHMVTTAACDSCHRTSAWLPAAFSHASVAPGTCASCHNGTSARGKTTNHVATTASCDTCHRTTAWLPATFSHASVAPGTCASCHNGTSARGKTASHFVTTRACDACHTTSAWSPAKPYAHVSPYYKPHNTGITCVNCHSTNSETATWTFAAYKPDCAGCHASRFKPDAHKKVDSPKLLYTVAELKDCSGSCHTYTNSTFTTILRSRSGEHRSTSGGF